MLMKGRTTTALRITWSAERNRGIDGRRTTTVLVIMLPIVLRVRLFPFWRRRTKGGAVQHKGQVALRCRRSS